MPQSKPYTFYRLLPDGRFEFFVDASLMKDFSQCEIYFYEKHIKNTRSKGTSTVKPFAMAVGSWWSDVMEMFYNSLRDGKELSKNDIQTIALTCWTNNKLDESAAYTPKQFEAFGDISGAVLMLQEYYDSQYLTDRQNWKIISVEEGFGLKKEVLLGATNKVVVYWIGKPDLTVAENGRLQPVDHKTVDKIDGRTTSLYKPSGQMIGYDIACEVIAKSLGIDTRVDRCVVNICARTRPTDNPRNGKKRPRFVRAYPNFNREEMEEWKRNLVARCERIAHCLTTGDWAWSDTTCHNMYHRDCDYLRLHSVAPSAREIVRLADYTEGTPWKPYQVKEDLD